MLGGCAGACWSWGLGSLRLGALRGVRYVPNVGSTDGAVPDGLPANDGAPDCHSGSVTAWAGTP